MGALVYEVVQCCGKYKILGHTSDHPWLVVGWSVSVLGGPSINNLLRAWNQLKWSKGDNWNPCFAYAQVQTDTWYQRIICPVSFQNIFCKTHEFIDCQMDHWWWDLGSSGGFMGRIWRPGDHISAALVVRSSVGNFSSKINRIFVTTFSWLLVRY